MDFEDGAIIVSILAVLAALVFYFGIIAGRDYVRSKAIEANVAEWVVDSKTGETEFKWKEAQ